MTNKSIEEDILATAQGKLAIDGKVIQAGKFDNKSSAAEQEALLRSLLEAEVEEGDEEDNGEMGDDEINELLARGEHEMPIFQRMDREREARAQGDWDASGGIGPKPERLIQDDEVPEVYKRDVVIVSNEKEEEEGRGQRVRAAVLYDDGLTEEQFLNVSQHPRRMSSESIGPDLASFICVFGFCSEWRASRTRTRKNSRLGAGPRRTDERPRR